MNAYLQAFFHTDCFVTQIVFSLTPTALQNICVQQLAKDLKASFLNHSSWRYVNVRAASFPWQKMRKHLIFFGWLFIYESSIIKPYD